MSTGKSRKTKSEVLNSNFLNQSQPRDLTNNFMLADGSRMIERIHEEQGKDDFLESFSDLMMKGQKNNIVDINSEETSVLDGNNLNNNNQFLKNILTSINNSNKSNKALIKIITSKFHELYLKLVMQIKNLKQENSTFRKKLPAEENVKIENSNEENLESESDSLKFLLNEEMECFNAILFDFNVQFNDMQSQEEALRRDILKKHKEIEKLNFDIEESKKQKESFVKELQTIALKLNEYKLTTPPEKTDPNDTQHFETDNRDDDDLEAEEFHLLMNAENREYLIKKIIQENKKYKSIVKVMKTEEADFNNYLMQMEAELENFAKFKNYCLTKVNSVEENLTRCRDKLDNVSEKVINIEFQLEIAEDTI